MFSDIPWKGKMSKSQGFQHFLFNNYYMSQHDSIYGPLVFK